MLRQNGKGRYTSLFVAALCVYLMVLPITLTAKRFTPSQVSGVNLQVVANTLAPWINSSTFPPNLEFETNKGSFDAKVTYTFDPALQEMLGDIYERYKPDYGAFVALDAETGAILAMYSFTKGGEELGNLNLNASYPAASVFKVITAAAALDQNLVQPETILPYNGKRSSLYKKQVLKHKDNKWTRRPSLKQAFAESINTVFARLGVFTLGSELLDSYATNFGFNNFISSDIFFDTGSTEIDADEWRVAESASGFTLTNTLSPIHAAMLASAIANEGRMATPHCVKFISDQRGIPLFVGDHEALNPSISPDAASKMRALMRETVRSGSARKSFKKFPRGPMKSIEVGGKTGSLTGYAPRGKYDWFVGYAANASHKIAFASLTINKKYWTVKSAYVARRFIETAFSRRVEPDPES